MKHNTEIQTVIWRKCDRLKAFTFYLIKLNLNNMKKSLSITWNETEILDVTGIYSKERWSGDRLVPNESADFEIEKIEYKGIEIQNLFDDETFYQISEKCLTQLEW